MTTLPSDLFPDTLEEPRQVFKSLVIAQLPSGGFIIFEDKIAQLRINANGETFAQVTADLGEKYYHKAGSVLEKVHEFFAPPPPPPLEIPPQKSLDTAL